MNNPLVSICMPTYNGAQFLSEALQSAFEQTYTNIEIIVSDDASSDETLEIVNSFKEKSNVPFSIYKHKPSGIGANWNYCIEKAKGKYIKLLFQDDVLLPDCIEKQVTVLEKNETIGLVGCKRDLIIADSYKTVEVNNWIEKYSNLQKNISLNAVEGGLEMTKSIFKCECFFQTPLNKIGEPPTVMFSKRIWNEVGKFREDLVQKLDYEFYYRLLKKRNIIILNETLAKFRLHKAQATCINKGKEINDAMIFERIIYYEFYAYLNNNHKLRLLKKYHPILKWPLRAYAKLKQVVHG